jgi:hypothetical protein
VRAKGMMSKGPCVPPMKTLWRAFRRPQAVFTPVCLTHTHPSLVNFWHALQIHKVEHSASRKMLFGVPFINHHYTRQVVGARKLGLELVQDGPRAEQILLQMAYPTANGQKHTFW